MEHDLNLFQRIGSGLKKTPQKDEYVVKIKPYDGSYYKYHWHLYRNNEGIRRGTTETLIGARWETFWARRSAMREKRRFDHGEIVIRKKG